MGDTNAIVKVDNVQDSCLLSVEAFTAHGAHCLVKSKWIKAIDPVTNLNITRDTICTGNEVTVQLVNPGNVGKLAQWNITPMSGVSIVDQDSIHLRTYHFNSDGDYQISITNQCGSSTTKKVHVITSPVAYAGENMTLNGGGAIVLNGTGSSTGNNYTYQWKSSVGAFIEAKDQLITNSVVTSNDVYSLFVSTKNAFKCSDSAHFTVLIDYGVKIPNVFSPNDDSKHDYLEIQNIQFYKNAVLYVYNQWGELVFESEPGYTKPWDGTRNGRKCDVSAYYYVLEFNERDKKPLTGPVTIVR